MTRTAALLVALLCSLSLLAAPPVVVPGASIVGTWRLIDASPVPLAASNAKGLANHKLYFAPDGTLALIPPDKPRSEAAEATWRFDGKTRTVILPDGTASHDAVKITGDLMVVTVGDGEESRTLTYRRINGANAPDAVEAPLSLEVLARADGKPVASPPIYDRGDYSRLPVEQRIRGIWESVQYRNVRGELPPYGFPNQKYVIDGRSVSLIAPNATTRTPETTYTYRFAAGKMVVFGPGLPSNWKLSFDRWGRLVIDNGEYEVTLRLVQRAPAPIPELPVKIALLETDAVQQ